MLEFDFRQIDQDIYGSLSYAEGMPTDPAKTALLIVDMMPALTNSKIGAARAYSKSLSVGIKYFDERVQDMVIPNIGKFLEFFRKQEMTIVYIVTWSETDDLSDMQPYWQRAIRRYEALLGEQVWRKWNEGMQICDEIAPRGHELVLPKRTSSAFSSSMLDFCLKNAGIETVVLTGCNTNGCVFETAVVGNNMGYDFILASDATACFAPALQDVAETWIARHFGIVRTTDETIALLRADEGKK